MPINDYPLSWRLDSHDTTRDANTFAASNTNLYPELSTYYDQNGDMYVYVNGEWLRVTGEPDPTEQDIATALDGLMRVLDD